MLFFDKILHSAVTNLLTFEKTIFFFTRKSGFEAHIRFYCLLKLNILFEPMKIQTLLSIIVKNHFLNLLHPAFCRWSLWDLEMIAPSQGILGDWVLSDRSFQNSKSVLVNGSAMKVI